MIDVPQAPPPPAAEPRKKPISHRIAWVGVKAVAMGLVMLVGVLTLDVCLTWTSWRAAIPSSCRQPSTIDYSGVGRPDYGPYSVKFAAWHELPWSESSNAIVGHGQSVDERVDYGVGLTVESVDIDRFECRWTDTGVTIVEPAGPGGHAGIEHFVPAERFLGGR